MPNVSPALSPSEFERTGKLQRKIDVFYRTANGWRYHSSTNWHRTCTAAKHSVSDAYNIPLANVRANFAA